MESSSSSSIESVLKIEDLTSEDDVYKSSEGTLVEDDDDPMLTMDQKTIKIKPSTSWCNKKQQIAQNKTLLEGVRSTKKNLLSFKIVQITDHKQSYLTAVPSAWERLGTLYWPNTTNVFIMEKLIQNSRSIPERYWLSQPCILKKANFESYESAICEIEQMDNNDNGKGYGNNATKNLHQAHKRNWTENDNGNVICNQKIFKKLLHQEADIDTKNLQSSHCPKRDNNSQTHVKETDLILTLDNITKNINQILKKQNRILIQLAKQNEFNGIVIERLNRLNNTKYFNQNKSCQSNMTVESSVQDDSNDVSSLMGLLDNPVSSEAELNELEINLNDSKKMQYLISKMKSICGETGILDATNCCYHLVDRFFTRSLLLNASWGGGSRTESRKIGLKNYRNVLYVFNKLVILASKDFDEIKSQAFFQKILHNAKNRYESQIDRTSTGPIERNTDLQRYKTISEDYNKISLRNVLNVPISNGEDLEKLEIDLADEAKAEYLISKMKRICGESGLLDSTNCCYNLVDRFFTRSFLVNVSWSGGSRTGGSKLALKNYRNTLDVFNRLVTLASKDFDECKSKDFFQVVLKNSKTRYMSEIDHIPRKSAKKVRRQKGPALANNEDNSSMVDVKCEFESMFEND